MTAHQEKIQRRAENLARSISFVRKNRLYAMWEETLARVNAIDEFFIKRKMPPSGSLESLGEIRSALEDVEHIQNGVIDLLAHLHTYFSLGEGPLAERELMKLEQAWRKKRLSTLWTLCSSFIKMRLEGKLILTPD